MVTVASRRRILAPAAALLAATALSCTPSPVRWDDPAPLPADLVSATELTFDAQGRIVGRPPSEVPLPVFARQCITSVRIARDTIGAWYATWWSIRPDSTAEIVVSRSSDAQTWGPAIRVDSTDAGRVGCRRPPPSIAADRGNVHVAYAMTAKEGPGIFASHSMDQGRMFHSPVAVVYGERIGLTSIAARGDIVAVAYEDPNTDPRRIGLALSRTMAHLFQSRTLVSPATGPASGPAVGLGDGKIVVTWARGAATDASPPRVIRTGDLQ